MRKVFLLIAVIALTGVVFGQDRDGEIKTKLKTLKVTCNFHKAPLTDVISFLQDISGINMVLDKKCDKNAKVTLSVKQIVLQNALNLVASQCGLSFVVKDGAILFSSKGEADRYFAAYADRASKKALAAEGGSNKTESCIKAGLEWLSRHQNTDGMWDQDGFDNNCDTSEGSAACDGKGVAQYDVGVSALATLAFLGTGHTHKQGKYKKTVAKGIQWLSSQQQPDGSLGQRMSESWIYNQAIGTLALCEAYAMTRDSKLKEPAQRAVSFILNAQNRGLAWKYKPKGGLNDTSITAWMVQAIIAAKVAELEVDQSALDGAINWLDRVTNPSGKTGYMRPGDDGSVIRGVNEKHAKQPAMTGAAIFSRLLIGQKRDDPKVVKGVGVLVKNLPEWNRPKKDKVDFYYWYYGTCAMFQYGGEKWQKWNKAMKKALLDTQRADGCAKGSWDPVSKWGMVGGRVYSTAINCLILEVYYRNARLNKNK